MKRIELIKLTLTNFQGGNFCFDPESHDCDVFGQNGRGKTRLFSAFNWLLFGKDSLGRSDFEIKNLDANGEQEHGLDHSVEATMAVDGKAITLKKVYHEVWQKKRGSAQAVFSGNTVDHFINGVPCQKKEYDEQVAEVAGSEETFRLLTSPTAFPALHWAKQRQLLLDVCGNISDAQVIESNEELFPLSGILMQRSIEDHKKVVAARRSEINRELDRIPVRIDEQKRMIPDISGLVRKSVELEAQRLETAIVDAKLRLSGIDNGGALADLSKQLTALNADIYAIEQKHHQEGMTLVAKLNQKIGDLTFQKGEADRKANGIRGDIEAKQRRIDDAEKRLQTLREEWMTADAAQFMDSTEQVCHACGQALPADRVQAARDKALAEFNRRKAERLEEITLKGRCVSADVARDKQGIEDLKAIEIPETTYTADLERLTRERDATKKDAEDYALIPERAVMIAKREKIEAQIAAEKEGHQADTDVIKSEIFNLEQNLSASKNNLDKFTKRESGEKRINDLKTEEKKLTAEYEELEKQLYLCEQFTKTKVSMLTDRINEKFETVKWKLYDVQINGGLSDCCVCTVGGVPYDAGLNSAGRTNAGIDIIAALQRHYQLSVPVFIDNAESVVELLHPDCQMIRLVVSEKDAVLRVEAKQEATLFGKRVAA